MSSSQVMSQALRAKIMSADDAAALVKPGSHVGMSGFTGSGYPKAVPLALARRIEAAHGRGEPFRIGVWTGASTAPELDGALAKANGIDLRLPYQSDPITRQRINAGSIDYIDLHLSHVAQFVWFGFLGHLDVAVIECSGIMPDGRLIPSTSIGNNKTWLDLADRVVIEVNSWMNPALLGMHDVYYGTRLPPHRKPIPIVAPGDRIGETTYRCDPDKVIAIVETHAPDRNTTFAAPDEISNAIAGHILEFFAHEVKQGRLPRNLLPLQSGVGNVANAVMAGLDEGPFPHLTAYTEVLQDGMLNLLRSGRMDLASATALSLSSEAAIEFNREIEFLRDRIVLRPQEISNHPEVIRRLGVIAMNGMIEADIYGNVNSTHVRGSSIMNGIGGSGDFARNAYLSIFMTPSTAKNGTISCIVPMVTHVDHTEHDVQILVTERGLADLRGLSPKQRARVIIENTAHPRFRPALDDYFERACRDATGKHTPHLLEEAFRLLRPE
ncbi:acetyl-CoA hydrolase/transferase family protein [Bradyrhizobium sp. SRS-191]|uniref:acetyl-CoA hydrolase/transferase family protein n=1 Tax=Bradyrhizobium sp. SRS-191 TaxID=2962606 RepID=UPI00211DBD93|nr:acetyl-CoA hydrolase/transferase family protein [Bradyrhizobium sp. SRS-191]